MKRFCFFLIITLVAFPFLQADVKENETQAPTELVGYYEGTVVTIDFLESIIQKKYRYALENEKGKRLALLNFAPLRSFQSLRKIEGNVVYIKGTLRGDSGDIVLDVLSIKSQK